jgi:hypothetical protein
VNQLAQTRPRSLFLPTVSFPVARFGAALVTGVSFFFMIALFVALVVGALAVERVGADHARWLFAIVLSSIPAFAVYGAATSFVDAYAQHRFGLPPWAAEVPAASHALNPRTSSLRATALFGLPIAIAAFAWISQRWPRDGLSRPSFVLWLAGCSGVIAAVVMFARTGRTFVREAGVAAEHRRFAGSIEQYLWRRHGWPEFLINAWFNGWAAAAMAHGPLTDPHSGVSRSELLTDALMTGCLLALFIALESKSYATFAMRWGVVTRLQERAPRGVVFVARLLGSIAAAWLLLAGLLHALGVEHITAAPLVIVRSLWLGAVAGVSSYTTARWTFAAAETQPAFPPL